MRKSREIFYNKMNIKTMHYCICILMKEFEENLSCISFREDFADELGRWNLFDFNPVKINIHEHLESSEFVVFHLKSEHTKYCISFNQSSMDKIHNCLPTPQKLDEAMIPYKKEK